MKDKGNHYYYYNGWEGRGKWEKLGLDWVWIGEIKGPADIYFKIGNSRPV